MVIYIIIAILFIAFFMRRKEGYFNGYYFVRGDNKFITGENECIYKDGIVSCKEEKLYPQPVHYKIPSYRYNIIVDRLSI